ncbi:MAG: pantoate--beta-alanine ligase [Schumannella sp.]
MSWRPSALPDGLALPAGNRFLTPTRSAALALSRALEAAASSADRGIDAVLAAAQSVLMTRTSAKLDYLKVVDPRTFQLRRRRLPRTRARAHRREVGDTRLIDNESLYLT